MGDELRRKSDEMLADMRGDIKLILSKLDDHSEWIKTHQKSDDDNFKAINNEIVSAKATVKTTKWLMGMLWTGAAGLYGLIEWMKTHK